VQDCRDTGVSAAVALSKNAAGVSVRLCGDPSRHFDWVVGADGLHLQVRRNLLACPEIDAPSRTLSVVLRVCGTLIPVTAICSNSDDFARAMRGAGERIQRDALGRTKVGAWTDWVEKTRDP